MKRDYAVDTLEKIGNRDYLQSGMIALFVQNHFNHSTPTQTHTPPINVEKILISKKKKNRLRLIFAQSSALFICILSRCIKAIVWCTKVILKIVRLRNSMILIDDKDSIFFFSRILEDHEFHSRIDNDELLLMWMIITTNLL